MNWITELPTEYGFYWVKDSGGVFLVDIVEESGGKFVYWIDDSNASGMRLDVFVEKFNATHWQGPIHEPKPPDA